MKKLLILVSLTLSLFATNIDSFAKGISYERDYKTALAKAKKANKPLMLVLGADYCPWCRKFERKTLSSKKVKVFVSSEVIPLIVDKKYDIETYPKGFQTYMTPRVFFINPHTQKSFLDTIGYIKKKEFYQNLKAVKKLYDKEK